MEELFKKASKARTIQELDAIIESNSEISVIVNEFENKYPEVDFTFHKEDVDRLIEEGIINANHTINFKGNYEFSTFEKLLLAVLWKNGQILRIQSILDGVTGNKKSKSNFGVIFQQFGRSLVDPEEPIVDQHVLRAFCTFDGTNETGARRKVPRKTAYKESDQKLINDYREWFKSILGRVPDAQKSKFKYLLDKLLFAIGKSV